MIFLALLSRIGEINFDVIDDSGYRGENGGARGEAQKQDNSSEKIEHCAGPYSRSIDPESCRSYCVQSKDWTRDAANTQTF